MPASSWSLNFLAMDEISGTYLEDFLLSLEILPTNVRRECELLKELDKEVIEINKDLQELENFYIDNLERIATRKKELQSQFFDYTNKHLEDDSDIGDWSQENLRFKQDIDSLRDRAAVKISEKAAIVVNLITIMEQFSNKLDSDLVSFENELKGAGEYEAPSGILPETEVAFRISADKTENTLILGQVIHYRSEISYYDILDIDDRKKYTVPESQVYALGQIDFNSKKLSKGDHIFALYPDTTIFYPAQVIQAPRRSALNAEAIVTIQFDGDEDPASGTTPQRTVQLKYVVRLPFV